MTTPTGYFDTRFTPVPARREVWRHVAAYLQTWIDERGALLDLGAGYGDFTSNVRAARRVALDRDAGIHDRIEPGIETRIGDATDLSAFGDDEFTTVFASNLLEHLSWEQLDRTLPQIRRVVARGGTFIAVQPNFRLAPRRYFDDYTHRTIFTDVSLRDFLNASGFEVVHVEPRFLPLTMKSRLSWGHRLVPIYLRLPYRPLAGQMLVVARRPP